MSARVLIGDCREVLPTLAAESVDACVTDPPYGLEFMGKEWDKIAVGRGAKYKKGGDFVASDPSFKSDGRTAPKFKAERANYVSRPAKRCAKCGKQAWSGSPCQCDEPEWVMDNSPLHTMQAWHETWAREVYRVLKPGAHLLCFGGTRTHHRLMVAIEDAGFEIRDVCMWLFGSGFPKSLDVSKALDKAAGAEREIVGQYARPDGSNPRTAIMGKPDLYGEYAGIDGDTRITAPATDLARQWDGWGTALKPAYEPIILARKPLIGSVAANVTAYGTGALNVDGCRIGVAEDDPNKRGDRGLGRSVTGLYGQSECYHRSEQYRQEEVHRHSGRWPANVILGCACDGDEHEPSCAVALLDAQSGESRSGIRQPNGNTIYGRNALNESITKDSTVRGYVDSGGPSRYFYTAKSSRAERNKGLEGMVEQQVYGDANEWGKMGVNVSEFQKLRGRSAQPTKAANHHPTVKPVDLMQWLVRLVCPKGGTVLDPFMGSGSTGIAADREGCHFIGIDSDPEYAEIARRRIYGDAPLFAQVELTL